MFLLILHPVHATIVWSNKDFRVYVAVYIILNAKWVGGWRKVYIYLIFYIEIQFFYARQHICYSAYMPSQFRLSVCPSVRPSVTRVDQSKTVEVRIMQFSP